MRSPVTGLVWGGLLLIGALFVIGALSMAFEQRNMDQHPVDEKFKP